jgi:hypothetical protein
VTDKRYGCVGVHHEASQSGRDVRVTEPSQERDGGVAKRGEGFRSGSGPDAALVFVEADVPDAEEPALDAPVRTSHGEELLGTGAVGGQARYQVLDLAGPLSVHRSIAGDLRELLCAGPVRVAVEDRRDFDDPRFPTTVRLACRTGRRNLTLPDARFEGGKMDQPVPLRCPP